MPQGTQNPTNTTLVAGRAEIREFEVGANATPAKMLPRRLVIYDADADDTIKEAGDEADNVRGVLMEDGIKSQTEAYAVADLAPVIIGGDGVEVMVTFISGGGSASPGDWLVPAADGKVKKQAVGAQGAQGSPVGQICETCTGAADTDVRMVLRISPEPAATS